MTPINQNVVFTANTASTNWNGQPYNVNFLSFKSLMIDCARILTYSVRENFKEKFLTGRAEKSIETKNIGKKVVWTHAPRRYDTAHYIKHRQIINESGSYALDLQNYGSRFYVYKIRRNPDGTKYRGKQSGSRSWEQKNLQKVRVYKYLGNHKNYFGKAFNKMVEFLISLGGEIEWNIH